MSDDQICNLIENYVLCSLIHTCANSMRSALELQNAIAQLDKAKAAMSATGKEAQND